MTLVQMTVSGGILIAAIVLLRLWGQRLPRRLFHGLWLLAALLLPFSIPAPTSVYNLPRLAAADQGGVYLPRPLAGVSPPLPDFAGGAWVGVPPELLETAPAVPLWLAVWLVVAVVLALCFLLTRLRGYRLYAQALPMENQAAREWLAAHPLKRRVALRCSDRIAAPLTYGLLRPVILLPTSMETAGEERLVHVLTHEWVCTSCYSAGRFVSTGSTRRCGCWQFWRSGLWSWPVTRRCWPGWKPRDAPPTPGRCCWRPVGHSRNPCRNSSGQVLPGRPFAFLEIFAIFENLL